MFGAWGTAANTNTTNNQAQPNTGGFGTSNAFGQPAQNTGGFGAFGQPQQNQQPSTGFGASTTGGGFGGFGTGSTAFGKPTTGFGATTGAFGAATQPAQSTGFGGGGFGANTGTSNFGQPPSATTSTSTFGTGFGSNAATSGWGKQGATTGFGTQAAAPTSPQGTANPPFAETTERDAGAANVTLHYHSISCMPAYQKYSPEELRVQDYAVGRKTATSNVPGATGFGAAAPAQTGFGATNTTFGQPQSTTNPTGGFGFGATNTNTNANANTGGGLFGTNTGATGFGANTGTTNAFGQATNAAAPANPFGTNTNTTTGAGVFGGFGAGANANTNTNTTGGFGAAANANKGFGAFGANTGTTPGGFGFGQNTANTNTGATGTGLFGQTTTNNAFGGFGANAQKPTTGFGATQTTGGMFGQTNTNSAFGQQSASNPFGQPAQPAAGGFGATNNAAATGTNTAFGGFGQPAAAQNTNPFGQPAQPTANAFGAFGQNAAQPAANTGGFGGLFNNKPATPVGTTAGFGFGQGAAAAPNPAAPGLNLGGAAGGNLFGQPTANTGGLFGPKPGGIFGAAAAPNPFGNFGATNAGGLGGSLAVNPAAAAQPANPFGAFAGFGQSTATNTNPAATTNLFGASTVQPQQQQAALTASVDQPFNSGIPVFELLPGAAAASASLAASAFGKKKQPNFFMKRKPLPSAKVAASFSSSTASPTLRGFVSSSPLNGSVTATKPGPSGISLMLKGGTTPGNSNSLSTFGSSFMGGSLSDKKGLSADVFVNSPGRTSVKKLVLDKDVTGDELSNVIAKNAAAKKNTGNALELLRGSPAATSNQSRALVAKPPTEPKEQTDSDKLEKGDYWIQPSDTQLSATPFKELEALSGFKCGRVGYGQVEFLDPVNLTTVGNVKEIPGKYIIFDEKECTVYPDEQDKPPVGQGLNVRARITLQNCWAVDRATREPIKDENHPRYASHIRKLKSIPNTTFEKFDPETGEWAFLVEHFSRYGLGPDDEDDEEEMPPADTSVVGEVPVIVADRSMEKMSSDDEMEEGRASVRAREIAIRRSKEPTPGYRRRGSTSRRRDEMSLDENDADNDEDDADADVALERRITPWPAQLGMDPQRMGQMQSNLFAPQHSMLNKPKGSNNKALIKPPPRASTPSALGKHPRDIALMEEDAEENGMQRGRPSIERPSFAVARPAPDVQDQQMMLEPPARKFLKISTNSLVEGQENIYRDAGLAFGRSFRVGWGPGGTLVHLGAICGPYDSATPPESISLVQITSIDVTAFDEEPQRELAKNHLRVYSEYTNATTERLGIPKILRDDTLTFQAFASLFPQNENSFEALLWRLASALYDEIPLDIPTDASPSKKEWIATLRRKMKVSDWLQSAVTSTVEQVMLDGGATPIAKVFALLTGNQVERACQVAMDAGDFHLATLIAQIGGDKKFRDTMWRQWELWVKEATDVFIDEDYRKVYAVIAGETTLAAASKSEDPFLRVEKVDITKGLDWKRIFALHLWYSCRMEDPVTTAVELYDETASERAAAARGASADEEEVIVSWVNPPPWYRSQNDAGLSTISHIGDPLLHLLRLFQDREYLLSDTLAPLSYSPHPLDYRLPWHLFIILKEFLGLDEMSRDFTMLADQLTISYAMQLESFGVIEFSVFVLVHLSDPLCRAAAIQSCLMRNADKIDMECKNILSSFNIPDRWILSAEAAYARYRGDSYEASRLYLDAREEKFACDLVISDLAPDIIIRADFPLLKQLFSAFNPEKIDDWAVRGKLFLDYTEVIMSVPDLVTSIAQQPNYLPSSDQYAKAERYLSTISNLLRLLPPVLGATQDVAASGSFSAGTDDAGTQIYASQIKKRHRAALDEMMSGLVNRAETLQLILQGKPRTKLDLRSVEAGARLKAVRNAAYERFCSSVDVF
ncbi:hypothetical protein CPB86DRAFT_785111 [Serendipita vermifera]|nr:hypothetical protein CPB86DRAFT_785111 [Serendipita vermifera]